MSQAKSKQARFGEIHCFYCTREISIFAADIGLTNARKFNRGDCEVTGVCLSTIPMVYQVSSQCLRDEKIHAIKTKVNERLI